MILKDFDPKFGFFLNQKYRYNNIRGAIDDINLYIEEKFLFL